MLKYILLLLLRIFVCACFSLPKSEVKSEPSPGVVGTVAMSPTAGTVAVAQVVPGVLPQYMLQVMVQMPGGDMVPVQIPAAPAALSQCNVPTGLVSMTASGAGSSVVAVGSGATAATAPLSTKQVGSSSDINHLIHFFTSMTHCQVV